MEFIYLFIIFSDQNYEILATFFLPYFSRLPSILQQPPPTAGGMLMELGGPLEAAVDPPPAVTACFLGKKFQKYILNQKPCFETP